MTAARQLSLFPEWLTHAPTGLRFCPSCRAWERNVVGAHAPGCTIADALPMVQP